MLGWREGLSKHNYLDLLKTCRTIYAEARLVPFTGAMLFHGDVFSGLCSVDNLLTMLPVQRFSITKMVLCSRSILVETTALAFLKEYAKILIGLRRIFVSISEGDCEDSDLDSDDPDLGSDGWLKREGEEATTLVREIVGDSVQVKYGSCWELCYYDYEELGDER